jgi:NTP pyrophosphatase (non-canonical NTP hydrolase)
MRLKHPFLTEHFEEWVTRICQNGWELLSVNNDYFYFRKLLMTDFIGLINDKALEIHQAAVAKGFWENPNIGEKCMLICCEVAEAIEADRKSLMDSHLKHRRGLEVELADALIRIMDLAGYLQIDLGGAIVEKLAYNAQRPHKHGSAY